MSVDHKGGAMDDGDECFVEREGFTKHNCPSRYDGDREVTGSDTEGDTMAVRVSHASWRAKPT